MVRIFRKMASTLAILAVGVGGLVAPAFADATDSPQSGIKGYSTAEELRWTPEKAPNYYKELGKSEVIPEMEGLKEGETRYCDRDDLKRTICAGGLLTETTKRPTQSLPNPSGWPAKNPEVTIPSANGGKDYHGWLWNRSHLLAATLDGSNNVNNLITGTRTQNVGNSDNKGGMAYTEIKAREYLNAGKGADCPLYYAAKPIYLGEELIPRAVVVDMRSCDTGNPNQEREIDMRVLVYNAANGFSIDYNNGTYSDASYLVEVTPEAPKLSNEKCGVTPTVVLPEIVGVKYAMVDGEDQSFVTVIATPEAGYAFPEGAANTWELKLSPAPCEKEPIIITPTPPVVIPAATCGVSPKVTTNLEDGITYSHATVTEPNGQVIYTVTAEALEGYEIAEGAERSWSVDVTPVPCDEKELIPVEPTAPVLTPAEKCGVAPTVTYPGNGEPALKGVTYSESTDTVNGAAILTVKATPEDGYTIPQGTVTAWSYEVDATACPLTRVSPTAPVFKPSKTESGEGTVVIPTVEGVKYTSETNTIHKDKGYTKVMTVTATPEEGFEFPDGDTTKWVFFLNSKDGTEKTAVFTETPPKVESTGTESLALPIGIGVGLVALGGVTFVIYRKSRSKE